MQHSSRGHEQSEDTWRFYQSICVNRSLLTCQNRQRFIAVMAHGCGEQKDRRLSRCRRRRRGFCEEVVAQGGPSVGYHDRGRENGRSERNGMLC